MKKILYTVYILQHPETDEIKYVGITSISLPSRLNSHNQAAKKNNSTPICEWIRKLKTESLWPKMIGIEETSDNNREKYWINYYTQEGHKLLNCTTGGIGGSTVLEETRLKAIANRKPMKHTEETKILMSAAKRAGWKLKKEAQKVI